MKNNSVSISSFHSPSPLIPLPLGEGNRSGALDASLHLPASGCSRLRPSRTTMLPLPAGEGQGEGERIEKPLRSHAFSLTDFPPQLESFSKLLAFLAALFFAGIFSSPAAE